MDKKIRQVKTCRIFWRRRRDFRGFAAHSRRIVVCLRLDASLTLGSAYSLLWLLRFEKTIFNRFFSLTLAVIGKAQISTSERKKEQTQLGLFFFLAEKERFELSRRVCPTYTLSRGASSANLSTSPYIKSGISPHADRRFSNPLYYYNRFFIVCQYLF